MKIIGNSDYSMKRFLFAITTEMAHKTVFSLFSDYVQFVQFVCKDVLVHKGYE